MRINWLSILVAVIAQQVLGFCWYSRALFAEPWMAAIGKRPEDLVPTAGPFVLAIIGAVLLPLGIAWILHRTSLHGVKPGAVVGLGVAIFFTIPPMLIHEAFLGFSPIVLAIDGGKELATAFLVGAILGAWPRKTLAA